MRTVHFSVIFFLTLALFFHVTVLAQTSNATPSFDVGVVDRAMSLPLLKFGTTTNYPYGSVGPATHYLSIVAFLNPEARSSAGDLVADKVAAHLSNVVIAGNEPELRGIMFGWHDHHLGGAIALAKYTPAVWGKLSAEAKTKLDWIMKVGTYVGNIQHNAANQCYLDIMMKDGGNSIPNQRNPMVAWMSFAYIYFGGASEVNAILASYDRSIMMSAIEGFGWARMASSLNGQETVKLMESGGKATTGNCAVGAEGVKKAFTFKGRIVTGDPGCPEWYTTGSEVPYDPVALLKREEYDYNLASKVVDLACKVATSCGVAGHIKEGFASPHLNEIGMFLEYNVNSRSSSDYVSWGAKNALFHLATLIAGGFWETGSQMHDEILNRFNTAVEVWQYRVDESKWYDTAFCKYASGPTLFMGSDFALDLWGSMAKSGIKWIYAPITEKADKDVLSAPKIKLSN